MGQWIMDLAAAHRAFAERLADRQSQTLPAEDPRYGDLGQAFPPWPGKNRDAILQPPKPEIRPSLQVLEHAVARDADWEAADLRRALERPALDACVLPTLPHGINRDTMLAWR
jgi:hypothetical protein